jgi:RNA polymerase primary sigma factor
MTAAYSDESLELYFDSIRKIPLVSRQEEAILAGKIAKGDKAALKRLVEGNLRLVVRIAKSLWSPPHSLLDLIQEGNIGLVKAAERFDAGKNVKFATYAVWWIRQSISRSLVNTGRQIRLPHRKEDALRRINAIKMRKSLEISRTPTEEEVAQEMGCSEAEVSAILHMGDQPVALEQAGEDELSVLDVYEDWRYNPEREIEKSNIAWQSSWLLSTLPMREREVVSRRFGLGSGREQSLKAVGSVVGCSAETVRHIEKKALQSLWHTAARVGLTA